MTGRPALTPRPALAEVGSLQRLSASFRLALRASGRSPATITAYAIGVAQLGRYPAETALPPQTAPRRDVPGPNGRQAER